MRCRRCDADGPVELAGSREATAGTVAALLEQLPVVRCPAGHEDAAPVGDALAAACLRSLPHVRGSRWRRERCGRCGAPLTMPVRRTRRPVTAADLPDLPVLTLHLDVPVTRCGECAMEQVPARSVGDVAAAVRALFEHER